MSVGIRRVLQAILLLLLFGATNASAGTRESDEGPFFRLSRIQAVSLPSTFATRYSVTVSGVPRDERPQYSWYLHVTASAPCMNSVLPGGQRLSATEYRWAAQGSSFVWYHGAKGSYPIDHSYGCDQNATGIDGYPGTVTVVAEDQYQRCHHELRRDDQRFSPSVRPACDLRVGGILTRSFDASRPARLLSLYKVRPSAAFAGRTNSSRDTHRCTRACDRIEARSAAAAEGVRSVLPASVEFAFERLFDDVLVANASLQQVAGSRSRSSSYLDGAGSRMKALARDVSTCPTSATNTGGPPRTVVYALDRLAAEASALASDPQRTKRSRSLVTSRIAAIQNGLDSVVTDSFPAIFGIPFIELVDRTLTEQLAAGLAERAAGVHNSKQASAALKAVLAPTRSTGNALQRHQKHVIAVENSNA